MIPTQHAPAYVDVIVVEPHQHGIGWTGFFCEKSLRRTTFRSHLTLVEFARRHFGSGLLRKICKNRYGVIRAEAPAALAA